MLVGAMVLALVGPAEPAAPTFAPEPWERARRRWFRMAPPSLLHPDALRRPPCASMSSLFRLGSGRWGSWTMSGVAVSTNPCGTGVPLLVNPIQAALLALEWTPRGSPLSLFAAFGPTSGALPYARATGVMSMAGLRVRFGW